MKHKMKTLFLFALTFSVFVLQFSSLSATDTLAAAYPYSTNCFKGVKRDLEDFEIENFQRIRDSCLEHNQELLENSTCIKACILGARELLYPDGHPPLDFDRNQLYFDGKIDWEKYQEMGKMEEEQRTGFNYTLHPERLAKGVGQILGIDTDWLWDEKNKPALEPLVQQIAKCQEFSFIVPKADHSENWQDCKLLAVEYQEKMGILLNCLEEAVKC